MKNKPLVSIIIVNWNGGEVFEDCLKSLNKVSYPNWELIVVDNNSTDKSDLCPQKLITKAKKVKILKNKSNLGFAPANNKGLKYCKGRYVLLLNNDTKVERNFLSKLIARIEEDDDVGIIQPKMRFMDDPKRLDNAGSFWTRIGFLDHWGFGELDSKEYDQEKIVFAAKGACMLIRREVITKAGGLFDKKYASYFEESDFCWRAWLVGYKVLYYPKAAILHKVGFTIKRLNTVENNYHYYKNRIRAIIKNLSLPNLIITLSLHTFFSIGIFVAYLFKLNFSSAFMVPRAYVWNILNISNTLKERRKVQKMRVVSDKKVFTQVSRPVNLVKFFTTFLRVGKDIKS